VCVSECVLGDNSFFLVKLVACFQIKNLKKNRTQAYDNLA
jgi:hypothetical protein